MVKLLPIRRRRRQKTKEIPEEGPSLTLEIDR